MADFPRTYRAVVVPDLRELCVAQGSSIAHGLTSFHAAFAAVMRAAIARGAGYLSETVFEDLEDYLLTTLSRSAAESQEKLGRLQRRNGQ
jgi:hypothetical protein